MLGFRKCPPAVCFHLLDIQHRRSCGIRLSYTALHICLSVLTRANVSYVEDVYTYTQVEQLVFMYCFSPPTTFNPPILAYHWKLISGDCIEECRLNSYSLRTLFSSTHHFQPPISGYHRKLTSGGWMMTAKSPAMQFTHIVQLCLTHSSLLIRISLEARFLLVMLRM